jgi:hypothetical protein
MELWKGTGHAAEPHVFHRMAILVVQTINLM